VLPLSLKLHNFLSYRENVPTLHLEEVHVACLCGANGHGKSALLDAITWAIWGKARGQRQEQLLHQGQQEMWVELEFEARGQRYRVARRYSRARRQGASSLELTIAAGAGYHAITSNTMAGTQAHLHQLLNMDYDTFVNSAFLMQGRADLFTMSTASQRKEVLAKVLGLGLYDRLEELARERAREMQARLAVTKVTMDRLEEQVARRAELSDRMYQTEAELASSQQTVAALEGRLDLLRGYVVHLERRQQEAQELAAQHQRVETRRHNAEQDTAQLERRLLAWRDTIKHSKEIDIGYQALHGTRKRWKLLQSAVQRVHTLERDLAPLELRIAAAQASLESDIQARQRRIGQELVPQAEALPSLEQALKEATDALAAQDPHAIEVSTLQERQHQASLEARRLETDNLRIADAGRETRAKLDLLDAHAAHGAADHVDGASCPLCGGLLGAGARAQIQQTYHQQIESYRQQYQEQSGRITTLDREAAQSQAEAAERRREMNTARQTLESQRAHAQVRRDEALRAQRQLVEARHLLAGHVETLKEGRYAQSEQVQAAVLRQHVAETDFSSGEMAETEKQMQSLERWDAEHRRLEEAQARMPEDEAALARARTRLAEATDELQRLQDQEAQVNREVTELPGYRLQLAAVVSEHRQAVRQRDALQESRGSLTHQLEEVKRAETELRDHQREHQTLVQETGTYGDLAQAFGKGGVQALLIEAAIPRLQEEADRLLGRMTDGRMSLKIQTQRERRTPPAHGGAESIETLDILIGDELGTRSYEMFSGGERFRVDFALRVALSKLLAWRAGAPLPTLFIDEGFGTQDTEGRDQILDVIRSIEPDFQRILVITHLDEVKDAFPVRIEVTRTPGTGSTFSLS
jgi:exonuclease SbcC